MRQEIDGEKLLSLRKEWGMTQAQLAVKTGVDPQTIRDLEKNRQKPHETTLRSLAAALGVKPGALASDRL